MAGAVTSCRIAAGPPATHVIAPRTVDASDFVIVYARSTRRPVRVPVNSIFVMSGCPGMFVADPDTSVPPDAVNVSEPSGGSRETLKSDVPCAPEVSRQEPCTAIR